eukprot:s1303_g13.t1
MSIDISGPHRKGIDQRGRPTYFMVVVYTVPVKDTFPLPEGLQRLAEKEQKRSLALEAPPGSPLDRDDLLDQLEKDLEAQYARERESVDLVGEQSQEPQPGANAVPVPEDGPQNSAAQPPAEQLVPEQEQQKEDVPPDQHHDDLAKKDSKKDDPWEILPHRQEDLTTAEISWWDVKDQFWKDKIADLQDVEVRNLTFAVPMQSRHAREVVRAVQEVYMRLRSLNLPVRRLHSDRAREFTGVKLRDWCSQRDILQTSTAGDESAGNGRCESELGIIQAQTRVLGPAMGMSSTSKGYYIQSLTSGKFMRSTVVVNPPQLPDLLPELPQPDGEDYSPSFMPEDEADDHLEDEVEPPMELCPGRWWSNFIILKVEPKSLYVSWTPTKRLSQLLDHCNFEMAVVPVA